MVGLSYCVKGINNVMNDTNLEQIFLQALDRCLSLLDYQSQPTNLAWSAIELFAEVGRFPQMLRQFCDQYRERVAAADRAIKDYASSVDNWTVKGTIFGAQDQCNILHFFLNVHTKNFKFFRGENWTPQLICEFLQEWKGIDLFSLIADNQELVETGKNPPLGKQPLFY
ncbi:hypothetical protein MTo_04298 [Microcystis aeruginosa NIES-1211]|nr:hypothetical protein B5D77_18425 [Microcystis sp. MC19]GBL16972.1 hypothetical protein MTo_04298 [Microcystis aeruginosa NIES-1211]